VNVLIAVDKFKGTITALDAAEAIARGLEDGIPYSTIMLHPMADGGGGTLDILQRKLHLKRINTKTIDSIGRPIDGYYLSEGERAYIELANSSGLALLNADEYDPMGSNTLGTGLQILDAIEKGHNKIVLAIGGSSSTDAGIGILSALGFQFLDRNNSSLHPSGDNLIKINQVLLPKEKINVDFTILTDVKNKIFGPEGSAYVFAPQKGATQEQVQLLDQGLRNFSTLIKEQRGIDLQAIEGGGAAGGIAAGLSAFLDVKIENGFGFIAKETQLEEAIKRADLIITGEGKFDESSLNGKVVGEMIKLTEMCDEKLIVVCGQKDPLLKVSAFAQISACYELIEISGNEEQAKIKVKELLTEVGRRIGLHFKTIGYQSIGL